MRAQSDKCNVSLLITSYPFLYSIFNKLMSYFIQNGLNQVFSISFVIPHHMTRKSVSQHKNFHSYEKRLPAKPGMWEDARITNFLKTNFAK